MTEPAPRPVAFVLASTAHGPMLVNRNDFHLAPSGSYGVGYQLLERGAFDPGEVAMLLALLAEKRARAGDGVVAIDCGANIGVHTIEWARHMHGWGEVLAIEAQERVFYALAGNIALNNCFNARALWAAVGESSGTIRVPCPDYRRPASFGSLELRGGARTEFIGQTIDYADGPAIETRLMRLDELALARVDLIKLDVEGMEMEALRGASATIQRCRPMLLIEHIKCDEAELARFLAHYGYRAHPAGINTLAIHAADPLGERINRR